MKKIIDGWRHYPGIHCGSVALRDVAKYHNYNFSEAMCFGLGGGLGFYYSVNEKMSPTRSIHLRGPRMEVNFLNLFGMNLSDWRYEEDGVKAFLNLKEYIDKNIPVLIQTDIYYLDYYNSSTHFPGHIVVVCGYDDENEIFYLSDTGFENLNKVSYQALKKARCSKAEPYPLSNNWFQADLLSSNFNIKDASKKAILTNATMMKDGFQTLRGKSGLATLKKWADDLPNWGGSEDWRWCSRFSYQVISKRGVDGAGFRSMYRDFLSEVSELLPLIDKLSLVPKMSEIGERWSGISKLFKKIGESNEQNDQFIETSHLANEIFTLEDEFYSIVLNEF